MEAVRDFEDMLQCLQVHRVRYLIVGGLAFIFHAKPRYTKDMDIWIDPDPKNVAYLFPLGQTEGAGPSAGYAFSVRLDGVDLQTRRELVQPLVESDQGCRRPARQDHVQGVGERMAEANGSSQGFDREVRIVRRTAHEVFTQTKPDSGFGLLEVNRSVYGTVLP